MTNELGFIILRHVNSSETNGYWQRCYDCIREYYKENPIMIVDDNSNYNYVSLNKKLYNTIIIKSEYAGRGEILPYYYYLQNRIAESVIVLHDSVFVQKPFIVDVDKYKFLWEFQTHRHDQPEDEERIIKLLTNHEGILQLHGNKALWTGCFGVMTLIKYDFLKYIDEKHSLSNLLDGITCRYNRMSLERVFACILQFHGQKMIMFGDIFQYCWMYRKNGYFLHYTIKHYDAALKATMVPSTWKISFNSSNLNPFSYIQNLNAITNIPIVKIWSGR